MDNLSEYYKFNRDLPRNFDRGLKKILGKYYDKLRELDFKKVKAVLKEEQGISLTTHHNQSSFFQSDSDNEQK